MLENPQCLRQMIEETGAHQTNLESAESVEHLCEKCDDLRGGMGPAAEEYWSTPQHPDREYGNYSEEKQTHPELAAFEHAGK